MKVILSLVLVSLIVTSSFHYVYAAQLNAAIPKESDEFSPTYQFTRIVTIHHDGDSELAKIVGTESKKISFEIDSENGKSLMELINSELEEKSFVKTTDIYGTYSAIISPNEKSIGVEYRIEVEPTFEGHCGFKNFGFSVERI